MAKSFGVALTFILLVNVDAGIAVGQNATDDASIRHAQEAMRAQLKDQLKAAAQTAQTYHDMDNAALLSKLIEESAAKREPFNSLAFRELRQRRNIDTVALASIVRETSNEDGLLALLLLRRLDEKAYQTLPGTLRAKVLTDALRTSIRFNTWGLPGFYLEDASLAIIDTGNAATSALKRMLSDTRPAPVFGSQEYMIYKRYQFRVCDYALFFLEKIQGNMSFIIPQSVEERDARIRSIQK